MLLGCLAIVTVCAAASPALPADKPDLLVVAVPAGKKLDRAMADLIEKPLAKRATLGSAVVARKKVHLKGKRIDTAAGAQTLGRAARADYVLVLRPRGRGKKVSLVSRLVEVGSGKTVYIDIDALSGGQLATATAEKIVAQVADRLDGNNAVKDDGTLPPIDGVSPQTPSRELADYMDKQEGQTAAAKK
jgi:TolB-like protein